jgi:hypothetical protein
MGTTAMGHMEGVIISYEMIALLHFDCIVIAL